MQESDGVEAVVTQCHVVIYLFTLKGNRAGGPGCRRGIRGSSNMKLTVVIGRTQHLSHSSWGDRKGSNHHLQNGRLQQILRGKTAHIHIDTPLGHQLELRPMQHNTDSRNTVSVNCSD